MSTTKSPSRVVLLATLSMALGACATAPGPFERHEVRAAAPGLTAKAPVTAAYCPVSLTNRTDHQLDASYEVGGVTSMLGAIPAGRGLNFAVLCDAGSIEAFAVDDQGFLGGGNKYRTRSRLRPGSTTTLGFTIVDQVR